MIYLKQSPNPEFPNSPNLYYSISDNDDIPSYRIAIHGKHLYVKNIVTKRKNRIKELMEYPKSPFHIINKEDWDKIVNKVIKKLKYENR